MSKEKPMIEKIKAFLDQRQLVLWEEHERIYAAKKLNEMFNKKLTKEKVKSLNEGLIKGRNSHII